MGIKITDVRRADILTSACLFADEREEFESLDVDLDMMLFVRHDGRVYDLADFVGVGPDDPAELQEWDEYSGEGFFSGKVLRYLPEAGDVVEIGSYTA